MNTENLRNSLSNCKLCPRECGVNRLEGELGYCKIGAEYSISTICSHLGEEPAISGSMGSCTVFFCRCNLQCKFCQNYQISRNTGPAKSNFDEFQRICDTIAMFLGDGAHNVNFVSPSHVVPQMVSIIEELRNYGLKPTVVYNSNGYDKVETLQAIEKYVDVYLPDLKYSDSNLSKELSDAPNYTKIAKLAIKEMFRQKGITPTFNDDGTISKGVIVRHLVLPGHVDNSNKCLRFLADEISPNIFISLMSQYNPTPAVISHEKLGKKLIQKEYDKVLKEMERLKMENGWVQQLASSEDFNPNFDSESPFD